MNDTTNPAAAEQAAEHLVEKLQQMADDAMRTATSQEAAAFGTRNATRQLRYEESAAFHRALAEQAGREVERLRAERADASSSADDTDGPVHSFFGLTYSSYQVVPWVLAQSMPHEWQARFVQCMEELQAAFGYLGNVDYDVRPAASKYVTELTDEEMAQLGITSEYVAFNEVSGTFAWHDQAGNELDRHERVMVPVPDPLPPYSRGRTRVPRADQLAQKGGGS